MHARDRTYSGLSGLSAACVESVGGAEQRVRCNWRMLCSQAVWLKGARGELRRVGPWPVVQRVVTPAAASVAVAAGWRCLSVTSSGRKKEEKEEDRY